MNSIFKFVLLFSLFLCSFLVASESCQADDNHDLELSATINSSYETNGGVGDYWVVKGTISVHMSWIPPDARIIDYELYADGRRIQVCDGDASSGIGRVSSRNYSISHLDGGLNDAIALFEAAVDRYVTSSHTFTVVADLYVGGEISEDFYYLPPPFKATNPNPPDGSVVEEPVTFLTWSLGYKASQHDVYFGDDFENVRDADVADTTGVYKGRGRLFYTISEALECGRTYYWRIDEVKVDGHTIYQGDVWSFTIPPKTASNPNPPNGAQFVVPNVELRWRKGMEAYLHTVYFGDDFDFVENNINGPSQEDAFYIPGPLELDKNYYWRVDEYDGDSIYEGSTWNFKTLPAIQISEPDLIGWWKFDEGYGMTVVDWSGHGNHGAIQGDPQWKAEYGINALEFNSKYYVELPNNMISSNEGSICLWIKTTQAGKGMIFYGSDVTAGNGFGSEDELHVNIDNNGCVNFFIEGGYNDVNLKTSVVNDDAWHYIAATWNINGLAKLYVDEGTPVSVNHTGKIFNLMGRTMIGRPNDDECYYSGLLDDIRLYGHELSPDEIVEIMRGDLLLSWSPNPMNGSTPYPVDAKTLRWLAGDEAVSHDVYLGSDWNDVNNADIYDTTNIYRGRQSTTSYNPPEDLQWDKDYFWRVDEYNADATISKGRIWSFTVANPLSKALDSPLIFSTGGDKDWFGQTITSYFDGDAVQSGDISGSQASWMRTTVNGKGSLTFYWKVSSEEDFDFLEFYIDSSLQDKISGSEDWNKKTYIIDAFGLHVFEWRYMKDGGVSIGGDCGWVDKLEWISAP